MVGSSLLSPSPAAFDAGAFIRDDLQSMRNRCPGHSAPVLDHHGFEKKVHPTVAMTRIDRLSNVQMPGNWETPQRFATRTELRSKRAESMRPHASYDVDGDGFVGQTDYAISKKHDLGNGGMLEGGGERDFWVCKMLL